MDGCMEIAPSQAQPPQLGRRYEPAFSKNRPNFQGVREGCYALDWTFRGSRIQPCQGRNIGPNPIWRIAACRI